MSGRSRRGPPAGARVRRPRAPPRRRRGNTAPARRPGTFPGGPARAARGGDRAASRAGRPEAAADGGAPVRTGPRSRASGSGSVVGEEPRQFLHQRGRLATNRGHCSHKEAVAMSTVGVRELKNRLTRYLLRTKHGEEIVVTARGKPIALLMPIKAVPRTSSLYPRPARLPPQARPR